MGQAELADAVAAEDAQATATAEELSASFVMAASLRDSVLLSSSSMFMCPEPGA